MRDREKAVTKSEPIKVSDGQSGRVPPLLLDPYPTHTTVAATLNGMESQSRSMNRGHGSVEDIKLFVI